MDELVEDFLVETKEGLEILDNDIVSLEQNPEDQELVGNIFRVMHTIKGTCGFLGLTRLASVAHAGENILDKVRDDEIKVTPELISVVLESIDQIKSLMEYLEENEQEPDGNDTDLINRINACAEGKTAATAPPPADSTPAAAPPAAAPAAPVPEAPAAPAPPADDNTPPADSDELQALFDATEPLTETPAAPAPPADDNTPPADSDELQALFDATEPLVETPAAPAPETAAAPAPKADDNTPPADSDELQALFDATEPLVETPAAPAPEAPAAPAVAAAEAKPEPAKQPAEKPKEVASKPKKPANQSIRVNLDVLNDLMQQASELVLTRNQLLQILRDREDSEFKSALQRLNAITTDLQEGVMKTRMQPIGNAWTKFPRIVRDLAMELDKKIELKMKGEDTELDRQLLEMITDPLTHMVRNSADHGLEIPEKRKAAGKSETGTIELNAYHAGGYIIIEIIDDGNGIDHEIIKNKALEKELASEAEIEKMDQSQILQFIFAAGFSTAEKITSVSGRGVGMDVVKSNIEKISGTVDVRSEIGKGSTFTIKIPLTLAIMPVLKVAASEHMFAIPQINVLEIVKTGKKSDFIIETINQKPVLRLRDKLLPLISLSESLELGTEEYDNDNAKFIVVCELGSYHFGVIVDDVFETEEIVVKPVSPILKHLSIYSGSTILGDGSVILILDPNGLAKATGEAMGTSQRALNDDSEPSSSSENASFILFKAGDATSKIVPLDLISRLEEIDVEKIEYSKGEPVIQYRDELMRIAKIDPEYKLPESGVQELLVVANGSKIMGLVVEEILDIVRSPLDKQLKSDREGFLGSMVINEKTCDVVDVGFYFAKTFGETIDSSSHGANSGAGNKIMVIDDSPFFRRFVPPELESFGYKVTTCSGAKEALDMLEKSNDYTAIITDINMPDMDGTEFARTCKQDERLKEIPIIAMSSRTENKEVIDKDYSEDFQSFVSKTNQAKLLSALKTALSVEENAA